MPSNRVLQYFCIRTKIQQKLYYPPKTRVFRYRELSYIDSTRSHSAMKRTSLSKNIVSKTDFDAELIEKK